MKRFPIDRLKSIKHAECYGDSFQNDIATSVCTICGGNERNYHIQFTLYDINRIAHIRVNVELTVNILISIKDEKDILMPYDIEDKNEFFQLSTVNDYGCITYDNYKVMVDMAKCMLFRHINEVKPYNY